jgi:hypothetical protein
VSKIIARPGSLSSMLPRVDGRLLLYKPPGNFRGFNCCMPTRSNFDAKSLLSNGGSNASALPLPCPQAGLDDSAMSEDCLSMILYVPTSLNANSNAPTLVWYALVE